VATLGVRELMAAWIDNFDDHQVEIHEIRDLDVCADDFHQPFVRRGRST
jgi:hypothetical protein